MANEANLILQAGLGYAARGWSIIPIKPGTKKAAVGWKVFQNLRPCETQFRQWFGKNPNWQLAVVGGAVSGNLVVRDFDELAAYEQWAGLQQDLASSLPTVATAKGRHVYFHAEDLRFRKLGDGEYRGERHYSLLPPSIHPCGHRYTWIIEPPSGPLPMIDPVDAGLLPTAESDGIRAASADPPAVWPPTGLTQRTQRFLNLGACGSRRNTELFCAACDMASKSISLQEATERLLRACGACQPPYPVPEALATIRSAYSKDRWQVVPPGDPWGAYVIPRTLGQRRDLRSSDKLVWAALDYRQRDKAECFPSLAILGADAGVSRDTAVAAVKRLEQAGLISVKRTYGQVSYYQTHLPKRQADGPPAEKPYTKYHVEGVRDL